MRSSIASARRAAALAAAVLAAAAPATEPEAKEPVSLAALLARFRALPGLEARFHEVKKLALLKAPLISEGTIHYAPPDRLARQTTRPAASTLIVDAREVRFVDAEGSQSIPLEGNPVVRLFVDAFLKVLAGDRGALERIFAIELRGSAGGWVMTLSPRLAPMTEVIERIVLEGRGAVLSRMVIREKEGDETVTLFSSVDVERRYTAEEKARVFGLAAR
jgi:outer membrane lipoprotein-sorting protein